jgi:hypothetical protein
MDENAGNTRTREQNKEKNRQQADTNLDVKVEASEGHDGVKQVVLVGDQQASGGV